MATALRTLRTTLVADLAPWLEGLFEPAICVAHDGSIYAAAARERAAEASPVPFRVVHWKAGEVSAFDTVALPQKVTFVQPLPDGVLLVDMRCEFGDENARVVSRTGETLRTFCLGDGIEALATTRDGTIWASYGDEGVFGNLGWGETGDETRPIGISGLVAFDSEGNARFTYDPGAAGTDRICDAYALNVGPREVWLYFYLQWAIVRIRDGVYRSWSTDTKWANGIGTHRDRVLLFGDYENPTRTRVLTLGDDGVARVTEELELVDPDGEPLGRCIPQGVNSRLFLVRGTQVLAVDGW